MPASQRSRRNCLGRGRRGFGTGGTHDARHLSRRRDRIAAAGSSGCRSRLVNQKPATKTGRRKPWPRKWSRKRHRNRPNRRPKGKTRISSSPRNWRTNFETEKNTPYVRFVHDEGLDIIGAQYVPEPAHRRSEALAAARRQGRLINHEPRAPPTTATSARSRRARSSRRSISSTRRWSWCSTAAARPRSGTTPARASPSSGRPARSSPSRSIAGTSTSTARARSGALCRRHHPAHRHHPLRRSRFRLQPPYDFKQRFNGEPDYFSAKGEQVGFLMRTNFVPDAVNLPLITAKERGAGGGHIRFNMAQAARSRATSRNSPSAPTRRRTRTGRARM